MILGLDGGGSKTLALLADENGQVLGRGLAGPSNFHVLGPERTFAVLEECVRAAFADAGLSPAPLRSVVLGLSGVDRSEDQAPCLAWSKHFFGNAALAIVNDAQIVLDYPVAGMHTGSLLAVISGTGAIVYGRNAGNLDGQGMERSSGWGYLLGDEGSGFWIGQAALRAVTRATDGREEAGRSLVQPLLAFCGLQQPQQLIAHIYGQAAPRSYIARLTRVVDELAQAGDAAAQQIVDRAGFELALAVQAVVRRLQFSAGTPLACALAGGVLIHAESVRGAFLQHSRAFGLSLSPVTLAVEPAQGALRRALMMLA